MFAAAVSASLLTAACGRSATDQQAGPAAEAVPQVAQQGGATSGGRLVEPVSTGALRRTLPTIAGWEMAEPRWQSMTLPIAYSQVQAEYTRGKAAVEMKVVDTGYAQPLIGPWSMFLATGYSRDTGDGYERAISVVGNPGFERFDNGSKRGELNMIAGQRFMVTIGGHDLVDTKVLLEFASKMDFAKVAALQPKSGS